MNKVQKLWPTLKRLLAYGSPYRKPLGLAVLMLWIAAAAEVAGPILVSYFIDNYVAKGQLPLMIVGGLAAAYILLELLAAALHYFQALLFNQAAVGVVQRLRTDVMDAALRQPLSAFDTQPVGQLISRVTNDTEVIKDLYVMVVSTVLKSAALIGTMLVAMFSLDWRMALVAVCIFPAVFVVMGIYQYYSTPIVRRVRSYLADINDGFNEVINGMGVIQQFRQQVRFGERMSAASQSHYLARMQTLRLDGFLLRPLLSLFSALVLCGLLMLFGFSGEGDWRRRALRLHQLPGAPERTADRAHVAAIDPAAGGSGRRTHFRADGSQPAELRRRRSSVGRWPHRHHRSELRLPRGQKVLQHISLAVPSRGFVALVGHTGSGKSTLANLLMGYYPVSEGKCASMAARYPACRTARCARAWRWCSRIRW